MRYIIPDGDADGLTAAYQLIKDRGNYEVITAPKRVVDLVNKVSEKIASGSEVVILDLSSETNKQGLDNLLAKHVKVEWIDHHEQIADLESKVLALINQSPEYNTSTIINEKVNGKYVEWAIIGAFGDNKAKKANELAQKHNISPKYLSQLKEIGKLLNYNGFAVIVSPEETLNEMLKHNSPKTFAETAIFQKIKEQYQKDRAALGGVKPFYTSDKIVIYQLPESDASLAMFGEFANDLQAKDKSKIYFVIAPDEKPSRYVLSIRTSGNPKANEIAKLFENGGGRADAAGANISETSKPAEYVLGKLKEAGYGT